MPRRARVRLPGVPVHAIQRGNNRAACFHDDEDRAFYLFQLGRLLGETECALHAYCLMTNHVHLLLTPRREESCALLFKRLGLLQTHYVNRKYRRTGTLWEGRYRSCLVQSETYVLACYRYIEPNPVRAGIVGCAGDYPWSSDRANAEGAPDGRITPHLEYVRLGQGERERGREYRSLFGMPLAQECVREIRAVTNGGYALGTEQFQREMAHALGRRVTKGSPGRPQRISEPTRPEQDLFQA